MIESAEAQQDVVQSELGLGPLAGGADVATSKARIGPRFNGPNTIDVRGSMELTQETGEALADFLREARALAERPRVRLEDEVSLVMDYLDLERTWFGSRLSLEAEFDPSGGSCLVPPLVLLPLFESSITTPAQAGVARLEARKVGRRLRIVVESPLDSETAAVSQGSERGPEIVRERLAAAYGTHAVFAAKRLSDRRLVVISIPVQTATQGRGEELKVGRKGSPE
jgi:LytS/YehU family sensor histidine kinase